MEIKRVVSLKDSVAPKPCKNHTKTRYGHWMFLFYIMIFKKWVFLRINFTIPIRDSKSNFVHFMILSSDINIELNLEIDEIYTFTEEIWSFVFSCSVKCNSYFIEKNLHYKQMNEVGLECSQSLLSNRSFEQ